MGYSSFTGEGSDADVGKESRCNERFLTSAYGKQED